MFTDRLRSYGAAKAELLPSVEHGQDQVQNNRAENSHQPTRLRERGNISLEPVAHEDFGRSLNLSAQTPRTLVDECSRIVRARI